MRPNHPSDEETIARDAVHVGRLLSVGDFESLRMLVRRINRNAKRAGIAVPPESAAWASKYDSLLRGEEPAACPSAYCPMCTGEVCELCGAGITRDPGRGRCEHDVSERHARGVVPCREADVRGERGK